MNHRLPTNSGSTFLQTLCSAALFLWTAIGSATGAVIVDDQYNDGGVTNGADAQDAGWTFHQNGGTGSLTVVAFNSSGNTSNSMRYNPAGFGFTQATGTFGVETLADGDTLRLSLDFRLTTVGNQGLRFALGTSSDTFSMNFGTGTTASGSINRYAAGMVSGTSTSLTTSGTGFAINNTLPHSLVFEIERSGSTLNFSYSVDGANFFTGTRTGVSNFNFSQILIGQGNGTASFNIDNVVVQTIPEPGTLTMAALLFLALPVRRLSAERRFSCRHL